MKVAIYIALVIGIIGGFLLISQPSDDNTVENSNNTNLTLSDIHGLEVDINDPDRLYLPNHQGLYVQEADGVITKQSEISDD